MDDWIERTKANFHVRRVKDDSSTILDHRQEIIIIIIIIVCHPQRARSSRFLFPASPIRRSTFWKTNQ
jgi:hypothetical protein